MTPTIAQPTPLLSTPAGWLHVRDVDAPVDALRPLRAAAERLRDPELLDRVGALTAALERAIDGSTDVGEILLPCPDASLPLAIVARELAEPAEAMDARIRDAVHLHHASALEGAVDVLRWVALDRDGDVLVHTTSYLAIAPGSARTHALLVTSTAIAAASDPTPLQHMGVLADTIVGSMEWLRIEDAVLVEHAAAVRGPASSGPRSR